ncbi:MAG: transporter [Nitrospirota bacterium]|nr:transporter [Nitrospirota bacterium]
MRRTVFVSALRSICAVFFVAWFAGGALAAHPLITDDTGTQGRGRLQLEINGEYANDNGNSETTLGVTLLAGLRDTIDLVLGVPYVFISEKDDAGDRVHENGLSDISLELKWRFYEQGGLGLALKPGFTLDTGDEGRGLGDGRPGYHLFFITTKELAPFNVHLNLGYSKNRRERRDIWHYSLAGEFAASEAFKIVANIGGETNADRSSSVSPLFLLGGIIYSVRENLDMDFGVKTGLNKAEPDYAVLAGMSMRF